MRGRPRKDPENEGERHTVQSVERTFDIMEALAEFKRPVTLSELSAKVDLNISTVHRLLSTLIERGYARQDHATGRYSVGNRLVALASGLDGGGDLQSAARPALQQLARVIGETANLSVRSGDQLVYIDQVQSDRLMRMFTRVGTSVPLYCTGSGKLFLAFGSEPAALERDLNRYLLSNRLESRTPATFTDPLALKKELQTIRERGYSFDNEEMEEGVICVAAPILDRAGQIVACLSISGPTSRLGAHGHTELMEVVETIKHAAYETANRLNS
ncbi:MAG: IclR family transcriptional regulator [Chloroflexi bacterium]|uniref:Glycerol operon regulatory protein n=1 Tax=Candidatus Chlorohelix allophototropha TaxID=3003348 RepID=A0A8T7M988_9CHLR|nr:IclR family transcriptional regulator [Chloroflexota bacterium]WJW68541.1 IclR family transcriptional regulator [Chloroflexota bacterium L227-S17]